MSPRREPPHNLDAERAVLGAQLLGYRGALDVSIDPEDFYPPKHKHVETAVRALQRDGVPVDTITVADWLGRAGLRESVGGIEYLHALQNGDGHGPPSSNVAHHAAIVRGLAYQRRMLLHAADLTAASYDGPDAIAKARVAIDAERPNLIGGGDDRFLSGDALLDVPTVAESAVWGAGDRVGWAEGESLVFAGPVHVGKTTIAGQLVAARLGVQPSFLGFPVRPARRVLYLACDRPSQIRRALARPGQLGEVERGLLAERLVFWRGPLPELVTKNPRVLVELARTAGADTVVVDSLKDVSPGLSSDEHGAAVNNALQHVLADGIEVIVLHHLRKDAHAPTLDDLFGSALITAGIGSIFVLWPSKDDGLIEVRHLKHPAADLAVDAISHDDYTGTTFVRRGMPEVHGYIAVHGAIAAENFAVAMTGADPPTEHAVRKARAILNREVEIGRLRRLPGARRPQGGSEPDRYDHPDGRR